MDKIIRNGWIRDLAALFLVAFVFLWLFTQNFAVLVSTNGLFVICLYIISIGIFLINPYLRDIPLITERENTLLLFFALFLIGGTYLLNKNLGYIYAGGYVFISVIFLLYMSISTPYLGGKQKLNEKQSFFKNAETISTKFQNLNIPGHNYKPKFNRNISLQSNVESAIRRSRPSSKR